MTIPLSFISCSALALVSGATPQTFHHGDLVPGGGINGRGLDAVISGNTVHNEFLDSVPFQDGVHFRLRPTVILESGIHPIGSASKMILLFQARIMISHVVMGESQSSFEDRSNSVATRLLRRSGSRRLHRKICVSSNSLIPPRPPIESRPRRANNVSDDLTFPPESPKPAGRSMWLWGRCN
jgi:hypothetical protein